MTVTITLVDDDSDILDSVKLMLEFEGWHIRTYTTGDEFLSAYDRCTPDCVVIDPNLTTDVSGADVARFVADRGIPTIGLTARPDSQLAKEVEDIGALVMLLKPVSSEQLVIHIKMALEAFS